MLATAVRAAPVAQTPAPPPAPTPLPTTVAQPAAVPGAPPPAAATATSVAVTPLASPSPSAETGPRQQGVGPDGGNAQQTARTPASSPTPRPAAAPVTTTPSSSTQVTPTPTGGQPASGATAPLGGAPVLALRPGTALLLQVTEMTPRVPGAAPSQQPMTLTVQGGVVSFGATVMGSTIAGQPIVETPLGLFTLGAKVALPEGTQLQLRVMQPPGTAATGQAAGQPATLMELSHQWTALDEALATLRAIDPKAAQAVLDQTIAKPGPQLAGGLAFFLVALRGGGDLKRWLGETSVQALEKSGRGKLIQRLSEEFREMAKAGSPEAAQSSEWRPMFMPVFDGEGIRQLRLFVHRDGGENGDDDAPPGKRFLVEADFTRLGQFQLDGLVQAKKLDLVVRTRQALPGEVTQNINAIFTRSLDAAGFVGKLRFEAGAKMVTPDPEAMYGHAPGVSA